jgi:ferredoxin
MGPRILPSDPPAAINPNSRLPCSVAYRSDMKVQKMDTVNTENTVIQMKKAL